MRIHLAALRSLKQLRTCRRKDRVASRADGMVDDERENSSESPGGRLVNVSIYPSLLKAICKCNCGQSFALAR